MQKNNNHNNILNCKILSGFSIEKDIKDQLQDSNWPPELNLPSWDKPGYASQTPEEMKTENWFYPYFAGFLDADGSIFCRIVERSDYKNLYQLNPGISLIQKTSRKHILLWFQKHLKKGVVRERNDGISELNISGINDIVSVLSMTHKYLQLKRKQSNLVTRIIESMPSTKGSPLKFLELCILCDKLANLNDSKTRKITSEIVHARYLDLKLISEIKV